MKEKGNEKHFDVLVGVRLSPDSFFSVASSLLAKLRSEQASRRVASYSVEIHDATRSLHQFGYNLPASWNCLFLTVTWDAFSWKARSRRWFHSQNRDASLKHMTWQVFDASDALGKHVHPFSEKIHSEIMSKFTFPPSVITRHAWSHLEATSSPPQHKKRLRPIIVRPRASGKVKPRFQFFSEFSERHYQTVLQSSPTLPK